MNFLAEKRINCVANNAHNFVYGMRDIRILINQRLVLMRSMTNATIKAKVMRVSLGCHQSKSASTSRP